MRVASGLLLPLVLTGCVLRGAPISPYGRDVTVHVVGEPVRGELIAVTADTIWVLQPSMLRPVAVRDQRRVDATRHSFGLRRTMRWMVTAGIATGAALFISCNSYESSGDGTGDTGGCLLVIPGTTAVFAAAGFLLGSLNERHTKLRVSPAETARLRPLSRYPQGLPDSARLIRSAPARSSP